MTIAVMIMMMLKMTVTMKMVVTRIAVNMIFSLQIWTLWCNQARQCDNDDHYCENDDDDDDVGDDDDGDDGDGDESDFSADLNSSMQPGQAMW